MKFRITPFVTQTQFYRDEVEEVSSLREAEERVKQMQIESDNSYVKYEIEVIEKTIILGKWGQTK